MKKLTWKVVGLIATVGGAIISVIANIADHKNQEETITKKVNEAVAKLNDTTEG